MSLFKFGDYVMTDFEPWIQQGFISAKRVLEVDDRRDVTYDLGIDFDCCSERYLRSATDFEISLAKSIDDSLILETTKTIIHSKIEDGFIKFSFEKAPIIYVFPN